MGTVAKEQGWQLAGSSAEALFAPGVRLFADGARQGGDIVAERVWFVEVLRLAGRITPGSFHILNPAVAGSFTLGGTIVVVDAGARIAAGGAPITLLQLRELHSAQAAGLPVAVHGYQRADGAVQAQRVDVTAG